MVFDIAIVSVLHDQKYSFRRLNRKFDIEKIGGLNDNYVTLSDNTVNLISK